MDRGSRLWSDLPQDIVVLIINKLRVPDQIRGLAVCKSWHDCKDYVRFLGHLPMAVSYELVQSGRDEYTVICGYCDLYSQKVYTISNSIEARMKLNKRCTFGRASRNGWLLQEIIAQRSESSSFLLHNPFTNHILLLPLIVDSEGQVHATMKADPSSPECEIFVLSNRNNYLSINTYCLSKDDAGHSESVVHMTTHAFYDLQSMLYMDGNIYVVFRNGVLYSYGLEDKLWKLLAPGVRGRYKPCNAWLLEINENIILVHHIFQYPKYKWMIFRFDRSEMSWVVETSLNSCAIYISNHVAFSTPLTNRYGNKLEGCLLFYKKQVFVADSSDKEFKLSESMTQSDEYGWTRYAFNFVEPPYCEI